jgi:hypothetical protein
MENSRNYYKIVVGKLEEKRAIQLKNKQMHK